jgi:hypothetical protein
MAFIPQRLSMGTRSSVTGTTGSGAAGRVAYWSGVSQLSSSASFLFDGTTLAVPDGAAATPSYAFASDATTGFYRAGSGAIGISSSGVAVGKLGIDTSFTSPTANPLIIKALAANANGLRIYANTATDVASILNGYGAALELGANNTVFQSISSNGTLTFGESGGTRNHVINGNFTSTNAQSSEVNWDFRKDAGAGDTTNPAQIRIGNSGTDEGQFRISFTNAAASGSPNAQLSFDPRNNGDTSNFNATRFLMEKVSGQDNGRFELQTAKNGTLITGFVLDEDQRVEIGNGTTAIHRMNCAVATAGSATMTMTNGPAGSAGNPAVFAKLSINGTSYIFPLWNFS